MTSSHAGLGFTVRLAHRAPTDVIEQIRCMSRKVDRVPRARCASIKCAASNNVTRRSPKDISDEPSVAERRDPANAFVRAKSGENRQQIRSQIRLTA
jgi:hypothetical protein